jgi:hypothetical protein
MSLGHVVASWVVVFFAGFGVASGALVYYLEQRRRRVALTLVGEVLDPQVAWVQRGLYSGLYFPQLAESPEYLSVVPSLELLGLDALDECRSLIEVLLSPIPVFTPSARGRVDAADAVLLGVLVLASITPSTERLEDEVTLGQAEEELLVAH